MFRSLVDAEAALERFAGYYNYHRLDGEIGWLTPGERYDGTPFTDRGFDNVPALEHLCPGSTTSGAPPERDAEMTGNLSYGHVQALVRVSVSPTG